MSWIAHLDLDAFFARCEELRNPELEERPVVICVYTRGRSSGAVSTSDYRARELGIGSGMPLSEAREKADEETVFLPVDHEYYRGKSREVMSIIRSHSREMQKTSVDEAYFRLEAEPLQKAKKVKAEIESLGLSASIGISVNKFMAKMASEQDKPDGLTLIEEEDARDFLSDKPVGELHGVGDSTEAKLENMGIHTCRDLLETDSNRLVSEMGRNRAASLKERAKGQGSVNLEDSERKQISKIKTLEKNSSEYRYLRSELGELSHKVFHRLERRGKAFRKVTVIGIDTGLDTYSRSRTIKTSNSRRKLFVHADDLLQQLVSEEVELRRLGLRASSLVDIDQQTSLTNF